MRVVAFFGEFCEIFEPRRVAIWSSRRINQTIQPSRQKIYACIKHSVRKRGCVESPDGGGKVGWKTWPCHFWL